MIVMEALHLQFEPGARAVFSTMTLIYCLYPHVATPNLIKSHSDFKERDPKKLNSCLNHSCFNFFSVKACLNCSACSASCEALSICFFFFFLLHVCSDGSPSHMGLVPVQCGHMTIVIELSISGGVHMSFLTVGSWYIIWHEVTVAQREQ